MNKRSQYLGTSLSIPPSTPVGNRCSNELFCIFISFNECLGLKPKSEELMNFSSNGNRSSNLPTWTWILKILKAFITVQSVCLGSLSTQWRRVKRIFNITGLTKVCADRSFSPPRESYIVRLPEELLHLVAGRALQRDQGLWLRDTVLASMRGYNAKEVIRLWTNLRQGWDLPHWRPHW